MNLTTVIYGCIGDKIHTFVTVQRFESKASRPLGFLFIRPQYFASFHETATAAQNLALASPKRYPPLQAEASVPALAFI
jgi:hypothetical protein